MEFSLSKIRIIFMGASQFAVPSLRALVEAGSDIAGVVTQPDKPKGRGKITGPTPVKEFALKYNLKVFEPKSLKDAATIADIKRLAPVLIAVVAYGRILPREVLDIPKFGCVNLHASLLSKYRGAAPINWAIINGDKTTGLTTMLMDEGMDTGEILLKQEVDISDEETAEELGGRLSEIGAEMLVRTISGLIKGSIVPVRQEDKDASYARALKKEDGRIDWTKSAVEIKNRIRGLYPWPGAYAHLKGGRVKFHRARVASIDAVDKRAGLGDKFHRARVLENSNSSGQLPTPSPPRGEGWGEGVGPGGVLGVDKDSIRIKCGSGILEVTELQIEGKTRMSAGEFVKGYKIQDEVFE